MKKNEDLHKLTDARGAGLILSNSTNGIYIKLAVGIMDASVIMEITSEQLIELAEKLNQPPKNETNEKTE